MPASDPAHHPARGLYGAHKRRWDTSKLGKAFRERFAPALKCLALLPPRHSSASSRRRGANPRQILARVQACSWHLFLYISASEWIGAVSLKKGLMAMTTGAVAGLGGRGARREW